MKSERVENILLRKGENKFSPSVSGISPLQASEVTGLRYEKFNIVTYCEAIRFSLIQSGGGI